MLILPIPLLTRFDLIFVVRDIPTKERDDDDCKTHYSNDILHKEQTKNLSLKLICLQNIYHMQNVESLN